VNLIGEHTDYNDGLVMPMALDQSTWIAAAPRKDRKIVVRSEAYNETCTIDLDRGRAEDADCERSSHWAEYVRGVATILDGGGLDAAVGDGRIRGADMLIASDVPIGAGLSSSAALEVACGFALADLAGIEPELDALARVAQRAEHDFVGTRCGIMDQMIACHGRAGQVLCLDTRTLESVYLPLPPSLRVVVCNTMVAHELASAEYNARRNDCERGVRALSTRFPEIHALRDATLDQLDAIGDDVTPQVRRRCRHVITETERVVRAAAALRRNDYAGFGALMAASHASLRDDYEVSCPELDRMAGIASDLEGVFGARMTGGGFGGCAIALVDARAADSRFRETIRERYQASTGIRADVWICGAGDGVEKVTEGSEHTEKKTSHGDTETRSSLVK
jgi:galactokinase